jgi:hypothetical protein
MRHLELLSFRGGIVIAPSGEQIRAAIVELPCKGDSGLHFRGDEPTASLVFTFHKELGFCVVLELSDGRSLVLSGNPGDESVVETWVCQNSVRMPLSHFTTAQAALNAAEAFSNDVANGGHQTALLIGPWITYSPEELR